MARRFQFLVSCPGCSGRWVDYLDEMIATSTEISPQTFARRVDYAGIAGELNYPFWGGRGRYGRILKTTLLTDPMIGFHRGWFGNQPAYWFDWSGMEYIFTPGGAAPTRSRGGRAAKMTVAELRKQRPGAWRMRLRAGDLDYFVPTSKADVIRTLRGAPGDSSVAVAPDRETYGRGPWEGKTYDIFALGRGDRGARGFRAPRGWHVVDGDVDGEGNLRPTGLVRGDKRSHTHLVERLPDGSWRYRCFPPTGWEPVANAEPLSSPQEALARARQVEKELSSRLPPFPAFGRATRRGRRGRRGWGPLSRDGHQTIPVSALGEGPFEIRIASAPNPDLMYGQGTGTGYWEGAVPLRARWVKARTIPEAVMVARTFIDRAGLGAGNWIGGSIRRAATGEVVATVSYNGRVWLPDSVETEDWAMEVV